MLKQLALAVFAALPPFAFSAAAVAQTITYVSATGNDANPCTAESAPCRTLQRGVNTTPAGGELRLLTPIHGNAAVNKSITLFGNGATIVGAIAINDAGAVVALRGLTLNGRHAFNMGVNILAATAVHIEDCTIERYTEGGITLNAGTAAKLVVSDTVSRDNTYGLAVANPSAQVAIESSRFTNNTTGLYIVAAAATVVRSVVSNNYNGIHLYGGTTNITETTAADNYLSNVELRQGAWATLTSSVLRGGSNGLAIASGASALITDTVFTHNGIGILNHGTLYTRQNNTLGTAYHGTYGVLTPVTGF